MKNRFTFVFAAIIVLFAYVQLFAQPDPPANLTASQTTWHNHNSVLLQWEASPTALSRYNVYKKNGALSDSGDFHKIFSNLRFLRFTDRFAAAGSTYSYYITAINNTGESQPSLPVEITLDAPPAPAYVYGKVTDDLTGLNLPTALVKFLPQNSVPINVSWTDTSGNYGRAIIPGNYYIYIGKLGYIPEYFENAPNIQSATLITINPGDSVEFNFALAKFIPPTTNTLSGNVTDENGNPLDAFVSVYKMRNNSHFFYNRSVRTDSLGNYSAFVKEGDTVVVFACPSNHTFLSEYYNNKRTFNEADRIGISGDVTDINFVMELKPVLNNGITGIVKNADNEGVISHVVAFRKNFTPRHRVRYAVQTDSFGVYSFANMIPGEYILIAHPLGDYVPTFFRYDGTQTLFWRNADSVVVDSTTIVDNINFIVLPDTNNGTGAVVGKLLASNGLPVNGAFVFAEDENGNVSNFTISDVNGNYNISNLLPGSYNVASDKIEYLPVRRKLVNVDFANSIINNVDFTLTPQSVTSTEETPAPVVTKYTLMQNYPNPFNPVTNISFTLPEKANVKLTVYNILGKEIATLINGNLSAGEHTVSFDASNLSSGVYFYRIQAGNFTSTRKMTYLR